MLAAHDWPALAATSGGLPVFHHGLLLMHEGQFEASRQTLLPLLPELARGADRRHEALARIALGSDAARLFQYGEAAKHLRAALACCSAALAGEERAEIEGDAAVYALLAEAAPMTLDRTDEVEVPLTRNPAGLREATVFVDGHPSRWIFAPAAGFERLSREQARAIGLKPLGTANLAPAGERPFAAEVALIPQLRVGGALFRNVPVLLCGDGALPAGAQGVLAQPVLALAGTVTATDDDHLHLGGVPLPVAAAPLFEDGGRLLAATTDGQLFAVDPARPDSAIDPRLRPAGGAKEGNLALGFGTGDARFEDLGIGDTPEPAPFAGTLGNDALDQLAAYSFDFRSMRFAVRTHPR